MHHEILGVQDPAAPTVLLSSGLGGAAHYWEPQLGALTSRFRVIVYDHRGTGRSPDPLPAAYSIADMAAEAEALLTHLGVAECHFIGHALGGLIGLRLAHDRPDLVRRLVLVNAWARTHPHTIRCFEARKSLLLNTGVEAYVRAQPLFLYPANWLASQQDWLLRQDAAGIAQFPGTETVLRRIGAILDFDMQQELAAIAAPVALIAARDDLLVPSACSLTLAELLPQATVEMLDHGGHACNITRPDEFNRMLVQML